MSAMFIYILLISGKGLEIPKSGRCCRFIYEPFLTPAVETIPYLSLVLYRINEQFAQCIKPLIADGHVKNALFRFLQKHDPVNYSEYSV